MMNPLQLQRLIDGECSADELEMLLAATQEDSADWQEIGTAFLEDQIWKTQFQSASAIADSVSDQPAQTADSDFRLSRKSYGLVDIMGLSWLSLTASLLLAAAAGYLAGQGRSSPALETARNTPRASPAEDPIADAPARMPKLTHASLPADYHLQLMSPDGESVDGSVFENEIPLYHVRSREQFDWVTTKQPAPIPLTTQELAQLSGQGMRANLKVNFVSGNLKDGRTFLIPIRTIDFVAGQ